jgi:hypothetical protein
MRVSRWVSGLFLCCAGTIANAEPRVGNNVKYERIARSEFAAPLDNAYVIPRYRAELGTSGVANSLPDPVWKRLGAQLLGTEAQALAITASVEGGPEFPLVIVSRDGRSYSAELALSKVAAPALAVPGNTRNVTLKMRLAKTFNSVIADNILSAAAAAAPLFGGVPAALLSPAAAAAGKTLDDVISKTFTTTTALTYTNDMTYDDLASTFQIVMTFYDGAWWDPKSNEIAKVALDFNVTESLVGKRQKGKFVNPQAYTILNTRLAKPQTEPRIIDVLQSGPLGNLMGQMSSPNVDLQTYLTGCRQIQDKILGWGLNDADAMAVLYSAIVTTTSNLPPGYEQCPTQAQRASMESNYGLPRLGSSAPVGSQAAWDTIFRPEMDDKKNANPRILKAILGQSSFREVISPLQPSARLTQATSVFPGHPVGDQQGTDLGPEQLDSLFKPGVVTQFGDYLYLEGGQVLVKKVRIGGTPYQATVFLVQEIDPDSGAIRVRLRQIKFFTPIFP